jgi:hypothetical protein
MYANAIPDLFSGAVTVARQKDEQIVDIVRNYKRELALSQDDFPSFHTTMRNLERMLLRGEKESHLLAQALSQLEPEELTQFNDLYCLWETKLEKRFVGFLNEGVVRHYLDYPLFARFERLIDREIGLLNGYAPKRFLFIGSGPMPITALCLQHRLGVQVDCLERFPDAVEESKTVTSNLGCAGDINIIQGYGEQFDVSEYDTILIALLAKPKRAILENIARSCRPEARIICRTSDDSRSVFYEPTAPESIPPAFDVVTHARAGIDDTISSVLLRKVVD